MNFLFSKNKGNQNLSSGHIFSMLTTLIPASSNNSRLAASSTVSPASTLPPKPFHLPMPNPRFFIPSNTRPSFCTKQSVKIFLFIIYLPPTHFLNSLIWLLYCTIKPFITCTLALYSCAMALYSSTNSLYLFELRLVLSISCFLASMAATWGFKFAFPGSIWIFYASDGSGQLSNGKPNRSEHHTTVHH